MQKYHSAKVVKFLANQQCYTSHILSGISAGEGIRQGISRHIFQTYRAKTELPHEIGLRYSIFDTAGVLGDKIVARFK